MRAIYRSNVVVRCGATQPGKGAPQCAPSDSKGSWRIWDTSTCISHCGLSPLCAVPSCFSWHGRRLQLVPSGTRRATRVCISKAQARDTLLCIMKPGRKKRNARTSSAHSTPGIYRVRPTALLRRAVYATRSGPTAAPLTALRPPGVS